MIEAFKKAMVKAFEKVAPPTNFLASFFKPVFLDGIAVEIQGQDVAATYSVDVELGTEGRRHEISKHNTEEFVVPEYNDFEEISELDCFKVHLGETGYEKSLGKMNSKIVSKQKKYADMQARAIEKQAADALLNGKIVLADKSKIEFRKKASHDIDCSSKKWSFDSNNPLPEVENGCKLIKQDGKCITPQFNLILESNGLNALLANKFFKENSNYNNKIERSNIKLPEEKTIGAYFHGQFSAGSYVVNLWAYDGSYTIPTGFGFANEGQQTTYIPKGRGILLPMETDYELYYGAMAEVGDAKSLVDMLTGVFNLVKTKFLNYIQIVTGKGRASLLAGVKCRPLAVPINIDTCVTFSNIV